MLPVILCVAVVVVAAALVWHQQTAQPVLDPLLAETLSVSDQEQKSLSNAVQTIDQITECYNTTGDYDFQIKVYARDMKAYQDFMLNTLGNIDCIGSLHSIIVIGEIKDSHYIPVAK